MEELRESLKLLESAYSRLKEALAIEEKSDIVLDATIQRFEFTFELAWKTVQRFARVLGAGDCNSARSCIKLAYRLGWIENEEDWLSFLRARNLTSHTYNREIALSVYETVSEKHRLFQELIDKLSRELPR